MAQVTLNVAESAKAAAGDLAAKVVETAAAAGDSIKATAKDVI